MGEVPAVREIHAQNGIAGVEERKVDGGVRLRAAVRLHVGVIAPEQLFAAFDGEVFHDIHILAAAVVALAGQALGVLVGEVRADGRHDRGGNKVFARDEFDVIALAVKFEFHRLVYFRVGVFDCRKIDHFPFSVVFFDLPYHYSANCRILQVKEGAGTQKYLLSRTLFF